MARIRSVKPTFCTSKAKSRLSIPARLFLVLLPTEADDKGRFVNSAKKLAGNLYPHDESVSGAHIKRWLKETVDHGQVCLYEIDGTAYGHVLNWAADQKPTNPTASRLPPCPLHELSGESPEKLTNDSGQTAEPVKNSSGSFQEKLRSDYGETHESLEKSSVPDLGGRSLELGDRSSSSSVSEEPRLRVVGDEDEEDFASILAKRWAEVRDDLGNPRRWKRTVVDDLRAAYASIAGAWTGTQAELADEVARCERKSPESLIAKPVDRHDCEHCERGWVDAEGGVVRCPNDDARRTG